MSAKIEIVNKRGTKANVLPEHLDDWLADKKEGWKRTKPVVDLKKDSFLDHEDG